MLANAELSVEDTTKKKEKKTHPTVFHICWNYDIVFQQRGIFFILHKFKKMMYMLRVILSIRR